MIIDPWTNVLCVYPTKRVVKPRVLVDHPVFLGVLLLRCVSKLDGRPCLYKVIAEAAEITPGQFICDIRHALHRLPSTLEYRGNQQQLDVRIVSPQMPKFLIATGQHRTGASAQAKKIYNTQAVVDPLTTPAIIELRFK